MLLVAVAALLLLIGRGDRRGEDAMSGAPVEDLGAPGSGATPTRPGAASALPRVDADDPLGALEPQRLWREQAARALLPFATQRLGRAPSAEEERRLLDALASLRSAARGLDRERLDPDDADSVARARTRTAMIVAADRTFHDTLGVGVADFLRALSPGEVEDLAPATPPA